MPFLWIMLGVLAGIALLVLVTAYICFRMTFYAPARKPEKPDEYEIPPGDIYKPYEEVMVGWMKELRAMPHEDVEIKSFDGLTLRGRYYEGTPGAPVELMFHGYRGTAERDLCGGVRRCFLLKRNVILIDQRASGRSDGHVISFGINERRDCRAWIDYAVERFGKDCKIVLTGISMGAATVLMTAGMELPENVVSVLADCGYSSAKEIITKVIGDMGLPAKLFYPFEKLGARIFGHFDLEETSPQEAMKTCKVPVIFIHGDADAYVPCEMSRVNYAACASKVKKLVVIPNAGHGLCYMEDREAYFAALREFSAEYGEPIAE